MKRKMQIAILLVIINLVLILPAYSHKLELREKVGVFSPRGMNIESQYVGPIVGLELLSIPVGGSFAIANGIEYFRLTRETYFMSFSRKVVPITISFLYFPNSKRDIYIGAGLGWYMWKSETIMKHQNLNISKADIDLGTHVIVGYNFKAPLFIEARLNSVNLGSEKIEGISFLLGYRF